MYIVIVYGNRQLLRPHISHHEALLVGPILPLEGIKSDNIVKSLYYDTDFAAEWTVIIGVSLYKSHV